MLGRLLLAAAAGHASNRGHEVAQFVRARAGLLKSIVLFRTHVDDALTVRIYKTLHTSLNNAKNYDLSILYTRTLSRRAARSLTRTRRP